MDMTEMHTIPLIAPTASGQTDLTAVLVTEYGPLQGHASPVIRRQEVSRYHKLDSTHIRVREVSVSLGEPKLASDYESCWHIGQLGPDSPLFTAAQIVLNK
jgi:hypothetical protein